MMPTLSADTQATLLLTAPLLSDGENETPDLLRPSEFAGLLRELTKADLQLADLLTPENTDLPPQLKALRGDERYGRLLERGLQLAQALEFWQSRAIWVAGRTDEIYPQQLRTKLKDLAPPLLYGCGDPSLLNEGGLAVVGSRNVNEELISFTEGIGSLAAQAGVPIVSGGARGIDQAAMRGSLEAGGKAVGVLADSLERAALKREHRDLLLDNKMVLISAFNPTAGFNVGLAMQRNKIIYALSDAALVVSSDFEKGGTWSGAVEQLDKFKFVPVYVRSTGPLGKGLEALQRKGAQPWPNPPNADDLTSLLKDNAVMPAQLSFLQN